MFAPANNIRLKPIFIIRILYARTGIGLSDTMLCLTNAQFVDCLVGISAVGGETNLVDNALFANVITNFSLPANDLTAIQANQDTFANAEALLNFDNPFDGDVRTRFGASPDGAVIGADVSLYLTNCVLANVTNVDGVTAAGINGFYQTPEFGDYPVTNTFYPFQTVGAGSYYLTNGGNFFNAGTPNLDPALLADLATKTTYPPMLYSDTNFTSDIIFYPQATRDMTGTPDLGFHYDPIDYYAEQYTVVSATLTVSGGAVIVCDNDNGIWLGGGSAINCIGTDTKPNWLTYYLCVQEEPVALGPYYPFTVCPDAGGGVKPVGVFQFTKFAGLAGRGNELYDEDGGYFYGSLLIQNCEFWNGWIELNGPGSSTTLVQNNLFARAPVDAVDHYNSYDGNYSLSFSNNLFWHLALEVDQNSTGEGVFYNNDFDSCSFSYGGSNASTTNGYNAYLNCSGRLSPTNPNDIVTNVSLAYQTGPFGDFYQPTNSPLIDKGSTTAIAAGLSSLTTQTNQTLDTGTVDIGYHYPVIIGSTGTDFWLAFCGLFVQTDPTQIDYDANDLMLYISGPVGATGTVTGLGLRVNDSTVIVTNCGDAAVNGTYLLTNLTAQERADWSNEGYDASGQNYQKGTNWISHQDGYWIIFAYDGTYLTDLYHDTSASLNATNSYDWTSDGDVTPAPITYCAQVALSNVFTVAAGGVAVVNISLQAMQTNYDMVETNGIHVTATAPVSVYAMDYDPAASAAFICYPTPLLGTNYCVLARDVGVTSAGYSYYSELAVVATVDNTTVTITPSPTANLIDGHTNVYSTNLMQGETYQINSLNQTDSDYTNDVTGTLITSDKPIGVFAGASIAYVPDVNTPYGNPLVQEQLPVEAWGTNALSMGFAGRLNGDSYRILAAYSNTVVTIMGAIVTPTNEPYGGPWAVTITNETAVTNLDAGEFYDIIIQGPAWFQANQPIQVAHFANGTEADDVSSAENQNEGDPCEILLPPTGHYLNSYVVFTLDDTNEDFDENFLNLIVPQSATNATFVDGSLVTATNYVAIGTSGYYGAQISITNSGTHTITSSQPVAVEVYGFGDYDAYGYFGGVTK